MLECKMVKSFDMKLRSKFDEWKQWRIKEILFCLQIFRILEYFDCATFTFRCSRLLLSKVIKEFSQ